MRFHTLIAAMFALALVAGLAPLAARAEIVINVDQGATQPLPIAIPAFGGPAVGGQISQVVAGDLGGSGLFRPLDPASFQEQIADINVQPVSYTHLRAH